MLLHSGHITACDSRHDSDIFSLHTDVLSSSRIREKTILILVHSALCTRLRRFPLLHGSGASIPGIGIFLILWYWDIEWR